MSLLLQDWVAHQAQKRPDALDVIAGSERLTYGELDAQSNRLARALGAQCRLDFAWFDAITAALDLSVGRRTDRSRRPTSARR